MYVYVIVIDAPSVSQYFFSSAAVENLCDEFWRWRLRESPEFATFCGVHDYDDQLDDTSVQGYKRRGVST